MDAPLLSPPAAAAPPEALLRNTTGLPHGSAGILRVRQLYLPYGGLPRYLRVKHGLPVQQGLVLHWFCVHRAEPIAPYASLILNYTGLSAEMRERAEVMVDEMFTAEEFGQLREYLFRRYGEDTRTAMLTTPFHSLKFEDATRATTNRPFLPAEWRKDKNLAGVNPPGKGVLFADGFYHLSADEDCSLPFEVRGYYAPAVTRVRPRLPLSTNGAPVKDGLENGEVELAPQ